MLYGKTGDTFYGQFHFEPWVKITSLNQIYDAIGTSPWAIVEMTVEQLRDYTYLLPPANGLAKTVSGIPIIIYGVTSRMPCPSCGKQLKDPTMCERCESVAVEEQERMGE